MNKRKQAFQEWLLVFVVVVTVALISAFFKF